MNIFTLQPANLEADIYIAEIVLYNNGVCYKSTLLLSISIDKSTEVPCNLNITLLLYTMRNKFMSNIDKISASKHFNFH